MRLPAVHVRSGESKEAVRGGQNNVKHQFEIVDGAGEWTDDVHICIESAIGDVIDVSALRHNSE